MAIKKTRTVVFARRKQDEENDRLYWAAREGYAKGVPFTAEAPTYGIVEIVEQTTTEHLRSDGRRMSGTDKETVERVLVTLNAAEVAHLIKTASSALVDALETGKPSQVGREIEMEA